MNAIDIGRSGLMAATAQLNASASNVANMRTDGVLPGGQAVPGAPAVYQPVRVDLNPAADGGVSAVSSPARPGYFAAYDPTAAYADSHGMVAAPDVDPVSEMVDEKIAMAQLRASLATLETAAEMQKSGLNLKA